MRLLQFLAWPVVCGVLLALLVLEYYPRWSNADGPPAAAPARLSYADAVARAAPAVVNIYTSKVVKEKLHPLYYDPFFNHFFSRGDPVQRERVQRSLGSGVIITDDGLVLTNNHVIQDAREIVVALQDGRETTATVLGSDPETDLAVLGIDLSDLTAIPIGEPAASRVGDVVLAIGNPYGFGHSVSQGIISATGRYGLHANTYENFIQTDAAINPGSSGGALIDARGRLLGINTVIYTQSGGSMGIGLAIPVDLALRTVQDLVEYGRPIRGWLGIEVRPLDRSRSPFAEGDNGVVVTGLYQGGPADRAGLMPGDILLRINGQPVGDGSAGMNLIGFTRPGEKVQLEINRDGRNMTLSATVEARPEGVSTGAGTLPG